jgi:hypothetical protein
MDVSTVSNAVNDALAGLPAGTSSFINQNIGTPQGQQAIYNAGVSLGLSQAQIAAAVSQATGMTVTPQQVAQVAQSVAPPAPAAPAPAPAQPQFVGSAAPGAVGTSYGQASTGQIASASQASPDVATALQNGQALLNYDADTGSYNLINKQTGAPISGNYQVQVGNNGQIGINVPAANGSMVQVAAKTNADGSIAPISSSNVLNAGVNQGAGGFAGGVSNLLSIAAPVAAIINPALIPYIAAYNSADAVNKKRYAAALLSAGASYAGFNPDSQLAQLVKSGQNVPTDANGAPTVDASTPSGTQINQIGNTGDLGATDYSLNGAGSSGTGLNVQQGQGLNLFDTSGVNPATGLTNGLGLQTPGATNLASMGGGQGLTIPTATGASTVNNATLGATGTTNYGTGGLPINPLTGQPIGVSVSNVNTGVTTPSSLITNSTGNVVGTPAGTGGTNTTTTDKTIVDTKTPTNTNALGLTPLQTGLVGSTLLNALGTNKTSSAISNAASTQAQAGQNVQDVLSNFYDKYVQSQQPYQNLGAGATQAIGDQSPYLTHQFNATDLQAGLAPNYDFMLSQGQGANRNLANVGGGLLSGNTLQGLNKYTQDYAQNAYQNAFNNYQTQRQNIYSNLSNAAGLGQTSLGQLGQVGASLGQTYGNVTTGLAASQAGAQTAQAVNQANLLSNLGNAALVGSIAGTPGVNLNLKT